MEVNMGFFKQLDIRLRSGGDDAVQAYNEMLDHARGRIKELEAAIETAGYIFRNTDSGPNLVRPETSDDRQS
jgi:hypothetical protein